MVYIGIDPGSTTGLAFYTTTGKVLQVHEFKSHCRALMFVKQELEFNQRIGNQTKLIIEDARKAKARPDLAKANAGKLQGVGYVKAYSKDWQAFCEFMGASYELRAPSNTKTTPEYFESLTGLKTTKTASHMRDAAMLVFGR